MIVTFYYVPKRLYTKRFSSIGELKIILATYANLFIERCMVMDDAFPKRFCIKC